MTHVVCEPCYDCKYADCVVVWPTECFWHDEKMLYIDPVECIDCEACIPECPVEAIFIGPSTTITAKARPGEGGFGKGISGNVPSQWEHFIRLNAERVATLKITC
jgi:ferredoxin